MFDKRKRMLKRLRKLVFNIGRTQSPLRKKVSLHEHRSQIDSHDNTEQLSIQKASAHAPYLVPELEVSEATAQELLEKFRSYRSNLSGATSASHAPRKRTTITSGAATVLRPMSTKN